MKYCRNCGHELHDEDIFCPKCGIRQEEKNRAMTLTYGQAQREQVQKQVEEESRNEPMVFSVLSLVSSLLSLMVLFPFVVFFPAMSVPGMVFSLGGIIFSAVSTRKNKLSKAGMVWGIICLIVSIIFMIIMFNVGGVTPSPSSSSR